MIRSLMTLLICLLPSMVFAQPAIVQSVPVRFVVETEAGRQSARRCAEIWHKEGARLTGELAPALGAPDTVTCLVMESPTFSRRFGHAAPDWGVGLAFPGGRVVALDYNRLPAVGRGLREVFLHEMVHALLFQAAGDTWLPTWFHEGCAMHYSGEWRFSDTVSLVLDGHVPSLDRLQGRFPASATTADRAYRTSLLAVTRLRKNFGPRSPGLLVATARQTGSFETSFSQVTGASLTDFTADFARAMKLRLGWLVILTRWPSLFVLMSLVFAAGAIRKIIMTRRRLAEMTDEEEGLSPWSE